MVTKKTTVLIVGCGSIGQRHARLLAERDDIEVWICDVKKAHLEATLAVAPGARAFEDFNAALKQGPGAVFVCTPDAFHRPMSIAALEAGCDVFCEKPLAESVANAEAIHAVAQASPRMLQVGYVLRCHPAIRKISEMTAAGELGNLIGGRALVGAYFTLMCAKTPYLIEAPNSLVLDYTHQIDYFRLFFGQVVRVSAESATLGDLEMMPRPNVFNMLLKYKSGAIVQLHLDYVQHPQRHSLEVFGDRRTVVFDAETSELRILDRERDGYQVQHITLARDDLYRTQIAEFLKSMSRNCIPIVSAADGVEAVRIAEAAIRSAREHRAIEM